MPSDQELNDENAETLCSSELQQIRDAVNELRALNPTCVLADVVEEKLRAIKGDTQAFRPEFSVQERRFG